MGDLQLYQIQIVFSFIRAVNNEKDNSLIIDELNKERNIYHLKGHIKNEKITVEYEIELGKIIKGYRKEKNFEKEKIKFYLITELFKIDDENYLLLLENNQKKALIKTNEKLYLDMQFPENFERLDFNDLI